MRPATTDPASTGSQAVKIVEPVALRVAFAGAARRYWIAVFPLLRRELSHWHDRADEIPDPVLRRLATQAQRERGNIEGAAAFAAFVPRSHRAAVVRAVVAFQQAYNYLDLLAEQPQADPVAGARGLHQALLDALDPAVPGALSTPGAALDPAAAGTLSTPGAAALDLTGRVGTGAPGRVGTGAPGLVGTGTSGQVETGSPGRVGAGAPDYYARYPQRDDNGYLTELVAACRTALATLPSYAAVAPATRRATERIVEFQSLNLSEAQGDHDAFARWAHAQTPPGADLQWWETAAAGGSSLGVYALIAAATAPAVDAAEIRAIEDAYFPWIGGLHSLLDHLVDRSEDAACAQRSLIDYYASQAQAAERMQALAERAASAARGLPAGRAHTVILAGMAGHYLSHPEASGSAARPVAHAVRTAIGGLTGPALLIFKVRRVAERLAASRGSRGESVEKHATSVSDRVLAGFGQDG
jgi:tetraprenyl-beta-curcumene synthase